MVQGVDNTSRVLWGCVGFSAIVLAVVSHQAVKPQAVLQFVGGGAQRRAQRPVFEGLAARLENAIVRMCKPANNLAEAKRIKRDLSSLWGQAVNKPGCPRGLQNQVKNALNHPSDPSGNGILSAVKSAYDALKDWMGC